MELNKYKFILLILIVLLFASLSGCVEDTQPPTVESFFETPSDSDINDGSLEVGETDIGGYGVCYAGNSGEQVRIEP